MKRPAFRGLDELIYGRALFPVECGNGLTIGAGTVIPEINFTLPPIEIVEANWLEIRRQYQEMIEGVLRRATDLEVPGLLVEFETLPPMTTTPDLGLELTSLLADRMQAFRESHGLKTALRLTPNDTREFIRPPRMRDGEYFEAMSNIFQRAASSGADLLAIESTGGKEVCDNALIECDLVKVVFSLGVLGARDMEFLWNHLVEVCRRQGIIASGDSACGFANTAMTLAEQRMIPGIFAAVVRVASVPRSLVAYRVGATGPSKDCAYEGPYMKALAGVPISMEGKSAACAHLSPIGNIAQALCDCWSNESVQNVQMLSGKAPIVSLEQLAYDCRLMNQARRSGEEGALHLRDWLSASDASLNSQAFVLRPDVVLRISERIAQEEQPYRQTVIAVQAALEEIRNAYELGSLRIPPREVPWLAILEDQADCLPDEEGEMVERMLADPSVPEFLPEEYGLTEAFWSAAV